MKINQEKKAKKQYFEHIPIFELAFRPFFLLASLSSIISLFVWLFFLQGYSVININSGLTLSLWHTHEMLFGFAATVAVGFILTAGQTWTGEKSIQGLALAIFVFIWLIARISFLFNNQISVITGLLAQIIWWSIAIFTFSKMVFQAKNKRNYQFIPLLSAMMLINIALIIADLMGNTQLALHLSRACVLLFTLMMGLIGGRVIPFFTEKGAKTQPISTPRWLNRCLPPVSVLAAAIFILDYFVTLPFTSAAFMILAGCLHLISLAFWRTKQTLKVSLLWSLHVSYLAMAIGLILLGLSYFQGFIPFSSALHVITIGAIGLMIFAMMSRVSLGHTGRPLTVSKFVPVTFIFLVLAMLCRVLLPALDQILLGWQLSAALWIISASIFLILYTPILWTKRIK